MSSQKTPWDLDLRIRDRNLQKGVLSQKDLERYLKDLPDLAAVVDPVQLPQPIFAAGASEESGSSPSDEEPEA